MAGRKVLVLNVNCKVSLFGVKDHVEMEKYDRTKNLCLFCYSYVHFNY